MKNHGNPEPEFYEDRNSFKVIFRNSIVVNDGQVSEQVSKQVSEQVLKYRKLTLKYCLMAKSAKEIRDYLNLKSRNYVSDNIIKPLLKEKLLEYTNKEEVKKISRQFMNFLEQQKLKEYKPNLDFTKKIEELKLAPKTKALLGLIYLNYWADIEGKEKYRAKLRENERRYQEELSRKYSVNNLFKNRR